MPNGPYAVFTVFPRSKSFSLEKSRGKMEFTFDGGNGIVDNFFFAVHITSAFFHHAFEGFLDATVVFTNNGYNYRSSDCIVI